MTAIDKVKSHYKNAARDRKDKAVPEWGDESGPMVVYWTPLTLDEQAAIYRATKKSGLSGLAKALVLKCEDQDGNKIFSPEDYLTLRKQADGKVVADIANAILGAKTVEDMEKNSQAIRS